MAPTTLRDLVPSAVADIVAAAHPARVILFVSVARGEDGPDSDLDFLVVLDHLDPADRARVMGKIRFAIAAQAPIDIFMTDVAEFERRRNVNGSMVYWPAREGGWSMSGTNRTVRSCSGIVLCDHSVIGSFRARSDRRRCRAAPADTAARASSAS